MANLVLFLLRLTFGLAFGMAITSSRQVTSGFFRNHLYVTLGLALLAALVSYTAAPNAFWWAVAAAIGSYVGSVCWLYEKKMAGGVAMCLVVFTAIAGTANIPVRHNDDAQDNVDKYLPPYEESVSAEEASSDIDRAMRMGYLTGFLSVVSNLSSGLLMGLTFASMLLGHWYLNSPTMELAPLRRLLICLGGALLLQAIVSAIGLACEIHYTPAISTQTLLFIALRWSFGLVGVAVLVWMAWQTLKIPNTQSATGILYVAVVGVFVGELTALLLSGESAFPL